METNRKILSSIIKELEAGTVAKTADEMDAMLLSALTAIRAELEDIKQEVRDIAADIPASD